MAGRWAAVRIRWALASALAPAAGMGTALAADLDAAWDAQLRGRLPQAQILLAAGEPASPEHRFALAGVALELGELDRAQTVLQPLAGDPGHPAYPRAALLLGRLHLAAGRDGDARRAFAASLERSAGGPYAAAAYLALIRLDLHDGAVDDADARLHRLSALGPSPELEIAVRLLDPHGGSAPVRPFPSPIGLFAAARLSGAPAARPSSAPEAAPLPSPRRPLPAAGLQPIAPAAGTAAAGTAPPAAAPAAASPAPTAPPAARTAGPAAQSGLRPAVAVDGGARFTLRLGSFRDAVNARHMVAALKDAGFPARAQPYGDYHRVLAGAAATRQEAASLLQRLRTIGYDGDVIPYPPDADR